MISHPQLDKIISLKTVDSTNLELKRKRKEFRGMNVLLMSDEQTHGKGQKGRTWASARNKGLWMSLHLGREQTLAQDLQLLSLYAGLCVWNVLPRSAERNVALKWPNDIFIGSKKVGGILTELHWQGESVISAIIGIGINMSQKKKEFPESIREKATSLSLEGIAGLERESLAQDFLNNFWEHFTQMGDGELLADTWNQKAYLLGQLVQIETTGGLLKRVFLGINSSGEAMISSDKSMHTFQAGEIHLTRASD